VPFYERFMRRRLLLGGAQAHLVEGGEGSLDVLDVPGTGTLGPLVLLHGFSATGPTQYARLIRRLRRRFTRIIVPDLPGHGRSSVPAGGLSGAALVRGLRDALAAVLDGPAVFFAASMGGAIAVRYAREEPARVRGLMLCSPGGAPMGPEDRAALIAALRPTTHRDALGFVDRLFVDRHPLRHLYAWGVRRQFRRPHLRPLLARVADGDALAPEDLAGLTMPVVVLWGRSERILPPSHEQFFRAHLPAHGRFESPEDFGHAPFLDRPDAVAQRIVDFATSLAGATADDDL
jgi:pimeloyl-ACP methyl ester carboxylesterase